MASPHEIRTSTEIDAPTDRVWKILTSFDRYPEWNQTLPRVRAKLEPGSKVALKVKLGSRPLPLSARMLDVEGGREFRWSGPPQRALGLLFRGEHYFKLEPIADNRTRFVHGETFGGALVPLFWSRLRPRLDAAYARMNAALKARAETSA